MFGSFGEMSVSAHTVASSSLKCSELGTTKVLLLVGHENVVFENCPETVNSSPIAGTTHQEVLDSILKQLHSANLHLNDEESIRTCLQKSPKEVIDHIDAAEVFIKSIHGKYKPSDCYKNISELRAEVMKFSDHPAEPLATAFTEILRTEMAIEEGSNVQRKFLHGDWLNFFHKLMHPVLLQKPTVRNEHGLSYRMENKGKSSFDFHIMETKLLKITAQESFYKMKTMPDSMYALCEPLDDKDMFYPFLLFEMKTPMEGSKLLDLDEPSQVDDIQSDDNFVQDWVDRLPSSSKRPSSSSSSKSGPRGRKRRRVSSGQSDSLDHFGLTDWLKSHHFLQLLSAVKSTTKLDFHRPTKLFGLYCVMNKVYITCLTIENSDGLTDEVLDVWLRCPYSVNGEIKFKMTCTNCLDILIPVHCKAFLQFLNIILSEQTFIRYISNTNIVG